MPEIDNVYQQRATMQFIREVTDKNLYSLHNLHLLIVSLSQKNFFIISYELLPVLYLEARIEMILNKQSRLEFLFSSSISSLGERSGPRLW